jgi:hypothetical protein
VNLSEVEYGLDYVRSCLLWDVTKRWLVVTDVSGQLIGSIFKGLGFQELLDP